MNVQEFLDLMEDDDDFDSNSRKPKIVKMRVERDPDNKRYRDSHRKKNRKDKYTAYDAEWNHDIS